MIEWPEELQVERGYSKDDVQFFVVRSTQWQKVRLSMKGKPTHEKLQTLKDYWDRYHPVVPVCTEIQIGNYLGALRRGGQLDALNRVRKYR